MTLKRKLVTIFFILLGLYTLVGFLVIPFLIRHFGEKALQQNVNEASQIEKVRLNPFALKLQVEGLSTADTNGAWSAKWDLAEVNLSALTFLKLYPVLDRVALDGADIAVTRSVSEEFEESVEEPVAVAADGWREVVEQMNLMEIPKLRVDLLEVSDGRAAFTDETNAELYTQVVEPINFSLSNLTTVSEDATTMQFLAETETGALLAWEGSLTSQPLRSSGILRLEGLRIDHLAPYYAELIRFNLKSAVFGLEFGYQMDLSNLEDLFALENGQLSLTNVVCEPMSDGNRILSMDTVSVEGVAFHFPQMKLGIERVGISDGTTLVRRDAEGGINLLGLLAERESSAQDKVDEEAVVAAASNLPSFSHQIDLIEVTNYIVVWEEDLSKGLAQVEVGIPSLQVRDLSSDLDKPFNLEAMYALGEQGTLELSGSITSATGALDLALNLKDFSLETATAYTNELADLNVESGLLNFEGRLLNQAEGGLNVLGSASIGNFAAVQGESGNTTYTWALLKADELSYTASPFALKIQSVHLAEPAVSLSKFAVESETEVTKGEASEVVAEGAASESVEVATEPAGSAGPNVVVESIVIESGSVVFIDESIQPAAEIAMKDLNVSLSRLNFGASEPADLKLSALFNESPFEVAGSLNFGAPKSATSLQIKLTELVLPQFSAYSGNSVGRRIDKGQLSIESDWSIVESQLKASNQIVIDQLNFGDTVDSEGAIRLPLDLAVTLLAGPNGVMDLSLPLSGDLSDPKVGIGQIVRTAIVGLVTGAVSAPFKMLSGLVGSEKDLSVVEFGAGDAQLSSEMVDQLNTMAVALKERPGLKLKIIPEITDEDVVALKRAQLRVDLLQASKRKDDAEYREQLTKRYRSWAKAAGATDAVLTTETVEGVIQLENLFIADVVVSDEAVSALARARATQVQQHLMTSHGLDAERLRIADVEMVEDGVGLRFDLR